MIKWVANYVAGIPPVFVDGCLYVAIACLTVLQAQVSSDDAAKWINAEALFWVRTIVSTCLAGATGLKMFRSTTFAEHQAEKRRNGGNTGFLTRSDTGP